MWGLGLDGLHVEEDTTNQNDMSSIALKTTCRDQGSSSLKTRKQKRRGIPSPSSHSSRVKFRVFIAWSNTSQSLTVPRFSKFCEEMELGTLSDPSQSTFSLVDEDHTFANAIRFTLNQDPRTKFCGYSIPHPSDNRVNIRIQTTGDPAKDVFKDACQDLMVMCQHVSNTFDKAVVDFKMSKSVNGMDIESNS